MVLFLLVTTAAATHLISDFFELIRVLEILFVIFQFFLTLILRLLRLLRTLRTRFFDIILDLFFFDLFYFCFLNQKTFHRLFLNWLRSSDRRSGKELIRVEGSQQIANSRLLGQAQRNFDLRLIFWLAEFLL